MILFVKGKLAIVGDFDHSDCDDIGTIAGAGAGGENLITGDWIGLGADSEIMVSWTGRQTAGGRVLGMCVSGKVGRSKTWMNDGESKIWMDWMLCRLVIRDARLIQSMELDGEL